MSQTLRAAAGETGRRPVVIDGLNCASVTPQQMRNTLAGGVSAINLTAIPTSADLAKALAQIEARRAQIEATADVAVVVTSVRDIEAAHDGNRVGVILGAQNSLMVEQDVTLLAAFRRLGLRIVQPTCNEQNAFGYGAPFVGDDDKGMTDAGRAWIDAMHANRLLIDLSHCGHRTSADYIAAARAPVVFSHANAYAVCPSPRNKTDKLIRAVADTGGLTGAVMWSPAVKQATRPTLDDYLDHLDHLADIGGREHVAFASDVSEGYDEDPEDWNKSFGPEGLYPNITGVLGDWYRYHTRHNWHYDSLAHTPRIWDGLRKRGWSEGDIEKVMSGNWLRVLREVWGE